jgi:hypothetical protein
MHLHARGVRVCCAQVGSIAPFSGPQAALAQEVSEMCLSSIITAQHADAICFTTVLPTQSCEASSVIHGQGGVQEGKDARLQP